MKLGIFGGSFDPVHLGHLLVAQAAMEELGLDGLFFIPAAQWPFKPENKPAPDAVRLQLLRLALAGKTNCEDYAQEIRRGWPSSWPFHGPAAWRRLFRHRFAGGCCAGFRSAYRPRKFGRGLKRGCPLII